MMLFYLICNTCISDAPPVYLILWNKSQVASWGDKKYLPCHLRRQALVHFLHHLIEPVYRDWMMKEVKEIYGSGEEGGVGPFSVRSYMEYMVEDGPWGDNIMLGLICSMWGVRVSILLSESCAEICLRHNLEWPECDFGLLFNCNQMTGHYSGVKRIDETGVECKFIKEGKGYSVTEDTRVRSEVKVPKGMVIISVMKLQALLKVSELAHKVRELVKERGGESHGEGYSGAGDSGGRPSASSEKGDDTEEEPEIDKDV